MSERNQLRHLCRWNQHLTAENRRLRRELRRLSGRYRELEQTVAEVGVQQEATDIFLGAAMDELGSAGGHR
jgi:hypothetical protein